MKSNFMLLLLAFFANSVFAQSPKHFTIYGEVFNYQNGKYTAVKEASPTQSQISSLKRMKDGSILAVSNLKTLRINNGKLETLESHTLDADVYGESASRLNSTIFSYEANAKENKYQALNSAGWDDLDILYIPDNEQGLRIIKGDIEKQYPLPEKYIDNGALRNITGIEVGFVAIMRGPHLARIVHFDGEHFKVYKLPEVAVGLNIAEDIYRDKKGQCWVAGSKTLYLFKNGQFEKKLTVDTKDEIQKFAVNAKGQALIEISSGHVAVYDIESQRRLLNFKKSETIIDGHVGTSGSVMDIEVDNQDRFVIARGICTTEYNEKNPKFINSETVYKGSIVIFDVPTFEFDHNFKVLNTVTDKSKKFKDYIGADRLTDDLGNEYILATDFESFKKIDKEGTVKKFTVDDLTVSAGYKYPDTKVYAKNWAVDKKTGTLYFVTATRKYTFKMNADESTEQIALTLDKKLGGKPKMMVFDDLNNAFWLATSKGYAYYPVSGQGVKYFTKKETGLGTGYGLFEMRLDEKGTLWVSNSKGLGEFTKEGFKIHTSTKEEGYISKFIIKDYNGEVNFVGTSHISQSNGGEIKNVYDFAGLKKAVKEKFPNDNNTNWVEQACFDKDNQLWVATKENIIGHFDGTQWEVFKISDFYAGEKIFSMFLDKQDRVNIVITKVPAPVVTSQTQATTAAQEVAKETLEDKVQKQAKSSIYFDDTIVLVDKNKEN
ncbi:ligand-binding sensor domain-containing protein [Flammeovirga aprica]|uniref:Uncharacterized protein n=1 Tax=Flammeovirga aprica JL-4 TaxID=694437 RepID=A0A7X9P0Y7_9BACT|nr:hypothetical protein [Flammeovirga aprica]NME67295.1 hypothetical protein [Flammeovirga aprica JL-4]